MQNKKYLSQLQEKVFGINDQTKNEREIEAKIKAIVWEEKLKGKNAKIEKQMLVLENEVFELNSEKGRLEKSKSNGPKKCKLGQSTNNDKQKGVKREKLIIFYFQLKKHIQRHVKVS